MKIELTDAGKEILAKAPRVAQHLLVTKLEVLSLTKLRGISASLDELVHILGVQKISPQLILSPELSRPAEQGKRGKNR